MKPITFVGIFLTLVIEAFGRRCPKVTISGPQILEPGTAPSKDKVIMGHPVRMHGDYMVAGGYGHDHWRGASFVFKKNNINNTWAYMQELQASEREDLDYFGLNLDITSFGGRYITCICSPFDEPFGYRSGSAHVFDLMGSSWTETQVLTAPGDGLGHAGAYYAYTASMEEQYLVVGSRVQNQVSEDGEILTARAGAVFVYIREQPNSKYVLETVLQHDRTGHQFGDEVRIVDVNEPGRYPRILAGSPRHAPNAFGGAFTFVKKDGAWEEEQFLQPNETGVVDTPKNYAPHHGEGLGISRDRLVLGGEKAASDLGSKTGAAYVYDFVDGQWTQSSPLWPDRDVPLNFGQRLDVEGDFIAVGAWITRESSQKRAGSWYYFVRCDDGHWSRGPRMTAIIPEEGDEFGKAIDIHNGWIAVGAPKMNTGVDPVNVIHRGAVYAYQFEVEDISGPEPTKEPDFSPEKNQLSFLQRPVKIKLCEDSKVRAPPVHYESLSPFRYGLELLREDLTVLRSGFRPTQSSRPAIPAGIGVLNELSDRAAFMLPYRSISVGEKLFIRIQIRRRNGSTVVFQDKTEVEVVPCDYNKSKNIILYE